jgi:hypothetical protein
VSAIVSALLCQSPLPTARAKQDASTVPSAERLQPYAIPGFLFIFFRHTSPDTLTPVTYDKFTSSDRTGIGLFYQGKVAQTSFFILFGHTRSEKCTLSKGHDKR